MKDRVYFVVIKIFTDTANAVAAHRATTAIGVIHLHARIGLIGRTNQNQPIATNPSAAVTHLLRHGRRIGHRPYQELAVKNVQAPSRGPRLVSRADRLTPVLAADPGGKHSGPRTGWLERSVDKSCQGALGDVAWWCSDLAQQAVRGA